MQKSIIVKGLKIFGAPVYIHWSALLVMGGLLGFSFNSPVLAIISICSYFGVILLHEAGHAYFARKLGYEVNAIYLGFVHGLCEYQQPYNKKHESIIACGGVVAQLIVAIPLILAAQFAQLNEVFGFGPIVVFLGYISVLVALINLAPSKTLDGGVAWKLVPIRLMEKKGKKTNKKKFKVIK